MRDDFDQQGNEFDERNVENSRGDYFKERNGGPQSGSGGQNQGQYQGRSDGYDSLDQAGDQGRYREDSQDEYLSDREEERFSEVDKYSDYDDDSSVLTEEEEARLQETLDDEPAYAEDEGYGEVADEQAEDASGPKMDSRDIGQTIFKFIGVILFVVVLFVNYMGATGLGVPNTQAEIADQYVSLLTPASFTFSIWTLIFVGVAATLAAKFVYANNREFMSEYKKVRPINWLWMVLNIVWVFTLTNDQLGVATFVLVLYTLVLAYLSYRVSSTPVLKAKKLVMKWPIGLHFGWLIAATFLNLSLFLVDLGLNGTGLTGVIWTMIAMILVVLGALYFFRTHENIAIFLPTLWLLIGVLVQQSPSSNFLQASTLVFILSVIFFVAGVGLAAIYIFQRFQKNRQK